MSYLSAACTGVYYIVYPVFYVICLVLHVLSIIIAPLLHLGHYVVYACWVVPIHLLAKFETFYIFFGVAVLVGVLTGTCLHYASAFFISLLNLESRHGEPRGRSLSSYRAEKQRQSEKNSMPRVKQRGTLPVGHGNLKEEHLGWERSNKDRGRRRDGLIPTTILEEEDSTEGGF